MNQLEPQVNKDLRSFSKEEWEVVAKELAKRMKDLVYMNALHKAQTIVKFVDEALAVPEDSFEITYKFQFSFNNIIQIVGDYRRKKEERNGKT